MGAALAIRTDLSPADFRALAHRERNGKAVKRMLALAYCLEGMERGKAAELVGMDRQVLRDTVIRYNAEGVCGLYDRPSPGRTAWITEDERAKLKEVILERPNLKTHGCIEWTLPILCEEVIAGQFGKTLHPASLSRIVREIGLSRQKTRPRHPKSDEKTQEAFKKRGFKRS
ncbi:transposase [Azospirillaceae bacterium]